RQSEHETGRWTALAGIVPAQPRHERVEACLGPLGSGPINRKQPSMPAVLKDLASGDVFALSDFSLIGRNDGVTIRLPDPSISRQHATIRREDNDFWIVDLGSANGSYVNNVALTTARVLRHGDRVQLGTAVL